MPGPYQLVFDSNDSRTSNLVLSSDNEYLKNKDYFNSNWLLNIPDPEEHQNALPQDFARRLLLNCKARSLTPHLINNDDPSYEEEFKKQLILELGEQNAKKLERYYLQDHSGGIQKKLMMFSIALSKEGDIGLIDGEQVGNIYRQGEDVYIESLFTDIKTFYSNDPDNKAEIPGYIYVRCKLTEQGLQIQSLEASNKLLQQLCLGNHDVIVDSNVIRKAKTEEKNLNKRIINTADTSHNSRIIYLSQFIKLAKIIGILNASFQPVEENQQTDYSVLAEELSESLSVLKDGFTTLITHFNYVLHSNDNPSNETLQLFKQLLDANSLIIKRLFFLDPRLSVQYSQFKKILSISLDFRKELKEYSKRHAVLADLFIQDESNINIEKKYNWLSRHGLNLDSNDELKILAAHVGLDSSPYENDPTKNSLIDNYKKAHANFLKGELKFSENLELMQNYQVFAESLQLAHCDLMLDFGHWLRSNRANNINKNGTFYITEQDAGSGLNTYIENKLNGLVKHTLQLNPQWLDDNGYKPQSGGYDLIDGFLKDFPRDGYNGTWTFLMSGEVIDPHKTATALEFLDSLQLSSELKRCMTYLVYQSGLTANIETLLRYTLRGPQGNSIGFDLSQRRIVVNILPNNKIQVTCKVEASVKMMQHDFLNFEYPNAPSVSADLSIEIDCQTPANPTIKTSFNIATAKLKKDADFEYKVITGAVNSSKLPIEKLDLLTPYGVSIGKFFDVSDDNFTLFENVFRSNGFYVLSALGWHASAKNQNEKINLKVQNILQNVYSAQLATESTWKSAAHQMIRLADKELRRKNLPLTADNRNRFNFLKQVGYNILVEIAAINLAKSKKVEESLKVFSRVLAHSKESNIPLHPRVEELLTKTPKRMVEFASDKLSTLKPNTDAYKRYKLMADKGLEILHKQAEQAYEELAQAKNDNNIEKIKNIFIRLRVLSTFLYKTESAITPSLMQLYSKYEALAKEIISNNNFKQLKIIDNKISSEPLDLERYIIIIFGFDSNGNPSPEVRFKDWICANNISRGKVSLSEVLENMDYPSPLTIPYAASANNPKVKQDLANLIKDLKEPLDQLDNSKQKIQANFRKLLEVNEQILPQSKRENFARLVHRTGLPRQQPKTAIRLRILSDRKLMAKLNGEDLVNLVKNDLTSALKSIEVGFFDGLFKTSNIKKYSGNDLVALLIANGGQKEIAEAIFDPKRRTFRNYYADKLSGDNLVNLVLKTTVADKYLIRDAKLAKRLLTVGEERLQDLLVARPLLFEALVNTTGDNVTEQRWKAAITQTKLDLQQANKAQVFTTPREKKDFVKLVEEVPKERDNISPRGVKSVSLVSISLEEDKNTKLEDIEEKNTAVSNSFSIKPTSVK